MQTRKMLRLFASAALLVSIIACGGDGEGTEPDPLLDEVPPAESPSAEPAPAGTFTSGGVRCHSPDIGTCEELSSIGAASPLARGNCTDVGGQWGTGPCPQEDRLGHCDTFGGMGSRMVTYRSELTTVEDARATCETLSGTWHDAQ